MARVLLSAGQLPLGLADGEAAVTGQVVEVGQVGGVDGPGRTQALNAEGQRVVLADRSDALIDSAKVPPAPSPPVPLD